MSQGPGQTAMIAPWWHLIVFFLIVACTVYSGWAAQRRVEQNVGSHDDAAQRQPGTNPELGADSHPGSNPHPRSNPHPGASRSWMVAAGMDMLFLFYCWAGVRGAGGNLLALGGVRGTGWREFAGDVGIALPFWVVWEAVAYSVYWMIGPSHGQAVFPLIPRTAVEAAAWMFLSVAAGFCEELIFRGYLQQQLLAVSGGDRLAAVVGQGLVFGLVHAYQGWKPVLVIAMLGILYGALAAWRGNLRANMLAHGWSDAFEGWLKFVMLPRWFPS
jgi:uncharacterized protein